MAQESIKWEMHINIAVRDITLLYYIDGHWLQSVFIFWQTTEVANVGASPAAEGQRETSERELNHSTTKGGTNADKVKLE